MGVVLESVAFDHARFELELAAFKALLHSESDLAESRDIQPFFRAHRQLSAYLGTFAQDAFGPATELAFEFPFFGDYRADLVVGDKSTGHFCVIEFEEGGPDSIFRRQPDRSNPEWSPKFEHGFSQLTDWFFNLDDYKKTHGFSKSFGHGHIVFTGLLIGRSVGLDAMKRTRLRWRSNKVLIDSNAVTCITFDDVLKSLENRYAIFRATAALEKNLPDIDTPPSE